MTIDKLYSKKVMEYFLHPKNMGVIKNPSGIGTIGNPVCGDVMQLYLKIKPAKKFEQSIITDAKFKTFGCGSAIASSSLATEWLKGKPIEEAQQIKNTDIVQELNLPPVKIHCSVLAEDAIKAALADYQKKAGDRTEAAR